MNIFSSFLSVSMLLGAASAAASVPATLEETLSLGLPVVEIFTVDGVEPTCTQVTAPEGSWGISIADDIKVPGSVKVYDSTGNVIYESGDYEAKTSGMTIKVRGNTSARYFKKPFKIKLQKKGDMLGRGDKFYNDKNWVLVFNHHFDNYMGMHVNQLIGQPWTPAYEPVNVMINGNYRGVYLLMEAVEQSDARIATADDGFVAEHDPYWWNEDGQYITSPKWNPQYNYTFKYPDYEDMDAAQLEEIEKELLRFEDSIATGSYPEVIDVDSFASWIIGQDVLGTADGGGVNWYLVKNSLSDNSLLKCGPMWDFDSAHDNVTKYSAVHTDARFSDLFANTNRSFAEAYGRCWMELKEKIKAGVNAAVEDLYDDEKWAAYNASVAANNERWTNDQDQERTTQVVREVFNGFYPEHLEWLDSAISKDFILGNIVEGIPTVAQDLSANLTIQDSALLARCDMDNITIATASGAIIYQGSLKAGERVQLNFSGVVIVTSGISAAKFIIR